MHTHTYMHIFKDKQKGIILLFSLMSWYYGCEAETVLNKKISCSQQLSSKQPV